MKIQMNIEVSSPEELALIANALNTSKPVEQAGLKPDIQKPAQPQQPIQPAPVAPIQPVYQRPAAPIAPPPTYQQSVPVQAPVTPAPQYSFEQLQLAGAELMEAGKVRELQGLLGKYKITRLPELPTQMYGSYALDLKALGARL